jgi:hypothetical protein
MSELALNTQLIDEAIQRWAMTAHETLQGWSARMPQSPTRIGAALKEIRDHRLYRGKYPSFELYCADKWGLRPERANALIRSVEYSQAARAVEQVPAAEKKSWVYFMQSGDLIKIGVARDVQKRIASLQCGNPEPITLLAAVAGDHKTERHLHQRFATDRVRGEWFAYSPAIKAYVEGLK